MHASAFTLDCSNERNEVFIASNQHCDFVVLPESVCQHVRREGNVDLL